MAPALILAIFFISIDRFLKIYALSYLDGNQIKLIGDIFKLNLAKNTGIAFSIPIPQLALIIFTLIIIVIILYYWLKNINIRQYKIAIPLTFILFGAISNIYDRIVYGFVIDYFDLKFYSIFNLADSLIVIGAIYVGFQLLRKDGTNGKKQTTQSN